MRRHHSIEASRDAASRRLRAEKREEIISVARDVFFEEGFSGASMATIATRTGGSKGTLYNYFKNKKALFAATIERECRTFDESVFEVDFSCDFPLRLTAIGHSYLSNLLSDRNVRTYQLVISEARNSPDLAEYFYEVGPNLTRKRLAQILQGKKNLGQIPINDCEVLADQFLSLCRSGLHLRRALQVLPNPSETEIAHVIEEAVKTISARLNESSAKAQAAS